MTVYSNERTLTIPQNPLPDSLPTNRRVAMDGLTLMSKLPEECIAAAFFDPQYRGVLDKLSYGNEGV
ncbi:MAG: site-specific DNA-methyltransferase, partial [Chloroflexi bacterium]|nr:site-specific DNA-methyltransferase [Chloroflexota bacterium]